MSRKQEWGRRRVDNQPYPKTRDKDILPSRLRQVTPIKRVKNLYHITSEEGLAEILRTGEIKPMTNTGYGLVASLTSDYRAVLQSGEPDIWKKKNVVIVLDASKMQDFVRPVEYLPRDKLNRENWWEDDKDFSGELEYRSLKSIPIAGSIIRVMRSRIKRKY